MAEKGSKSDKNVEQKTEEGGQKKPADVKPANEVGTDPKSNDLKSEPGSKEPEKAAEGEKGKGEKPGVKKNESGDTTGDGGDKTGTGEKVDSDRNELGTDNGGGEKKDVGPASAEPKTDTQVPVKPKRFKLPFFSRNKSNEKEVGPVRKISAEDAVNSIDGDVTVHSLSPEQELAEQIDEQIKAAESNQELVFRIKKRYLLVVLGFILVAWAVLMLWNGDIGKFGKFFTRESVSDENTQTVASENANSEDEVGVRIRIKNSSEDENAADSLAKLLGDSGYELVEIKLETTDEYEGVSIVTKASNEMLWSELGGVLSMSYDVSSRSAVLSDDSDFDAVILFGGSDDL